MSMPGVNKGKKRVEFKGGFGHERCSRSSNIFDILGDAKNASGDAFTLIDEEGRAVTLLAVNKVNIGLDVAPVACVTNIASVDIAGLVAHWAWDNECSYLVR